MFKSKIIIFFAVLAQGTWLYLIVGRYGILPIALAFFLVVIVPIWKLRTLIATRSIWMRLIVGAIFGYLGGVAAGFVAEFSLRGWEILERTYPIENIYWFPVVSMGWIFGIIVAFSVSLKNSFVLITPIRK